MPKLQTFRVTFLILLLLCSSCAPQSTPTVEVNLTVPTFIAPTSLPCRSFGAAPTPGPDAPSIFPPVTEADHTRGPQDAAVTVMVYGDFQDATSALFFGVLGRLMSEHPNDIRFISRPFPLIGRNDKALQAAQAVEAAHNQGKFWEMHDLLYTQQENWAGLSPEDFEQWSASQASALGIGVEQYQAEVKSEAVVNLVQDNFERAQEFGPFAVPLILINGEIYLGPQDFNSLNDIVRLIVLGKRQFTECPPFLVERTKQYIARLHTEKGDVVIQLFADKTPFTVNSFIFLAQSGWYDNITFHRVLPELYAQSGDPSGTGKGTPGYYVITEFLPELTFNKPGIVAMVNSGEDTSGSQFFITLAPTPQFDGRYTIFGEVLSGMDVLNSLTPRDAQIGVETPPGDWLLSVEIETK